MLHGVPFHKRYSDWMSVPKHVLEAIRRIDPLLDIKFYMPKKQWHLVRYPHGFNGKPVRIWALIEKPELGLHSEPGMWMYDALKAADMWHRKKEIERIENDNEEQLEKAFDNEMEDAIYEYGKDLFHAFRHLYDYGDNGSYKRFY